MNNNPLQPEQLKERYKQLPQSIIELFEYDTVNAVINQLSTEYVLTEEQAQALQMEIELILYLFLPREGLTERLQDSLGIDPILAQVIVDQLEEDLFLIVEQVLDVADSEREASEKITSNIETTILPSKNIAPDPATTPEKASMGQKADSNFSSIKPIRTFTEDVNLNRAHGYGAFRSTETQAPTDDEITHRSSQDDIIKR